MPHSIYQRSLSTAKPDPVRNLHAMTITDSFITIAWDPGYTGGESLDQWFVVDYRRYTNDVPGEWSEVTRVTDGQVKYTVEKLVPGTKYEIRVFSENVIGRNEEGQSVLATTDQGMFYVMAVIVPIMISDSRGIRNR